MFNLGVRWHDMYGDPLYENAYFLYGVKSVVGFLKVSLDFLHSSCLVLTACAHAVSLS